MYNYRLLQLHACHVHHRIAYIALKYIIIYCRYRPQAASGRKLLLVSKHTGNSLIVLVLWMGSNSLNVPIPFPICEDGIPLPYMIVADEAFPLKTYIQKPYTQMGLTKEKRIFNNRLSRARRIVENA